MAAIVAALAEHYGPTITPPGDDDVSVRDPFARLVAVLIGRVADARSAYENALAKLDAKSPYRNFVQVKHDALGGSTTQAQAASAAGSGKSASIAAPSAAPAAVASGAAPPAAPTDHGAAK